MGDGSSQMIMMIATCGIVGWHSSLSAWQNKEQITWIFSQPYLFPSPSQLFVEFVFSSLSVPCNRDFSGRLNTLNISWRRCFSSLSRCFVRKLYGKSSGLDQETNSNQSPDREGHLSVKSLDLANGPYESTTDGPATKEQVTGRDKKAFLRAVEQSIRTGQRIQTDQNAENPSEYDSHADPSNYFYRFINKYLPRRAADTHQTSDIWARGKDGWIDTFHCLGKGNLFIDTISTSRTQTRDGSTKRLCAVAEKLSTLVIMHRRRRFEWQLFSDGWAFEPVWWRLIVFHERTSR